MEEMFILFIIGIGVGAFGTLIGIGGGLIMIPLFTFCLPQLFNSVAEIIGTSLFGVFLNAISGTYAYLKQKKVYFAAAIPFALATIPGAFLGTVVAAYFTGPSFSLFYGSFILCMSILMYWSSFSKKIIREEFDVDLFRQRKTWGIILSGMVGFISSLFGIGGGLIHVPVLIYLLGFPPHFATATSHFILMCSSFIGVVSNIFMGHIGYMPAIAVGSGAVLGAQIGAKLSKKTKPMIIVILLIISLASLGIKMIMESGYITKLF